MPLRSSDLDRPDIANREILKGRGELETIHEVKKHRNIEVDSIKSFFDKIENVFHTVSKSTNSKVSAPRDIRKDFIKRAATAVLGEVKSSGVYRAVLTLKNDVAFIKANVGKLSSASGRVEDMVDKYRRFFEEFHTYIEYWETLKINGSLPSFSLKFSKYNRRSVDDEKKVLFRDLELTSKVISRIISSYQNR